MNPVINPNRPTTQGRGIRHLRALCRCAPIRFSSSRPNNVSRTKPLHFHGPIRPGRHEASLPTRSHRPSETASSCCPRSGGLGRLAHQASAPNGPAWAPSLRLGRSRDYGGRRTAARPVPLHVSPTNLGCSATALRQSARAPSSFPGPGRADDARNL